MISLLIWTVQLKLLLALKNPVALVKWLTKKGVENIQEDHQQAITDCDNQIQALEFTNDEER